MFKKCGLVLVINMMVAQFAFADNIMDSKDKACMPVVKACLDAGYKNPKVEGKRFWQDCMHPLLLDNAVANVSADAKAIKTCRVAKIKQLGQELEALKKADSK